MKNKRPKVQEHSKSRMPYGAHDAAPAPFGQILHGLAAKLKAYQGRELPRSGLSTGFDCIDRWTGGLQPGLLVIAGQRGSGAPELALNILGHVACDQGLPVVLFNLARPNEQIAHDLLCLRAGVDSHLLRRGKLPDVAWARLEREGIKALGGAPIYIDDCDRSSLELLCAKARRLRQERRLALLVVDEFSLLRYLTATPRLGRQRELAEASRTLKALAQELGIPVIVTCRLPNDESDCRRPEYSNLRRAGFPGSDADTILLLSRPGLHADPPDRSAPAMLIIAKNPKGPVMEERLAFSDSNLRFESIAGERSLPA